jgi:serine/threonine protein phosphatase PrpC
MVVKPFISFWGGALLGARSDQQDSFLTYRLEAPDALLAIVADGMGGRAAGALASQTAGAAFLDSFLARYAGEGAVGSALEDAVFAANQAIDDVQAGFPEREGMGTTLLAVYVSPAGLSWISVGDSLLLLYRDGKLHRLNEDHSLRGLPEFRGGRHGNMLRSALTGQDIALIDSHPGPLVLQTDDKIILASDGILTLSDAEISASLNVKGADFPEAAGCALLEAVAQKNNPKQDNCTLVLIGGVGASLRGPRAGEKAMPKAKRAGHPAITGKIIFLIVAGTVLFAAALAAFFW